MSEGFALSTAAKPQTKARRSALGEIACSTLTHSHEKTLRPDHGKLEEDTNQNMKENGALATAETETERW
jgi:hypothetical protein